VLVVLALIDPFLAKHPAGLPTGFVTTFFALNVMGTTLSAYLMLRYFVEQRARGLAALEAEQERSERLLLNVLPQPIAERLKANIGVIAEHYDTVSVLFADLVDFTAQSSIMAADELVALLDRVFSAFDRLADAEGLEKIKTIGDACMLTGGLPVPRPNHVEAVARTAIAYAAGDRCHRRTEGSAVARCADRNRLRARSRRGHRPTQVHPRPVGGHREHGQPDGVARAAWPDPGHGARRRSACGGRLRHTAARNDRCQEQGPHRDVLARLASAVGEPCDTLRDH
jgi:class 3 adenylate cyclase